MPFRGDAMLSTKTDRQLQIEGLAPQEHGFATFSLNIPKCCWGAQIELAWPCKAIS
jgi:hypothetical protein